VVAAGPHAEPAVAAGAQEGTFVAAERVACGVDQPHRARVVQQNAAPPDGKFAYVTRLGPPSGHSPTAQRFCWPDDLAVADQETG
jgi:hypothetical protein